MYKRFLFILSFLFLLACNIAAQVNTSSPYSRFGIGDLDNQILGKSIGMGGISNGMRAPFEINIINPASYTALPNKVFLFQVGLRSKRIDFLYQDQKESNYEFSLVSINAAFKLNKYWAMSFGLNPLSSVGYEFNTSDTVITSGSNSRIDRDYSGEGGLTKLYFGNSFQYSKFSVGLNASYVFGPLTKKEDSRLYDAEYQSLVTDIETIKINDLMLRYGIQYSDSLSDKFQFTVGGFFENKTDLNAHTTKLVQRVLIASENIIIQDTIINDTVVSGKIGLPISFGAGFSITTKRLIIGADYQMSNWKDVSFFGEENPYLTNSYSIAVGAEYTKDYMSKKYFNTINLRIGGKYSKTNININGNQISDKAITFGFGFPTKVGTKINVGFEIGSRGALDNNLIKENYYLMNLNFNMLDRWFVRRKFF